MNDTSEKHPVAGAPLIEARGLTLVTPNGRQLVCNLNLSMTRECVAVIGRNGVGKSSLLEVLAGHEQPHSGRVAFRGERALVRQDLEVESDEPDYGHLFGRSPPALLRDQQLLAEFDAAGLSPVAPLLRRRCLSRGERRKLNLLAALSRRPDLLLLDEPTQDLDMTGVDWLAARIASWPGALLMVSHHRGLLEQFSHFFVMAESGCRYLSGSFGELEKDLEQRHHDGEKKYLRALTVLLEREQHHEVVCRRRRRKKNLGRLHEQARAPSMAQLKGKKSYAQASQGKAAKIRAQRIDGVRNWARASRRALSVKLPLKLLMPSLPASDGCDIIVLSNAATTIAGRALLSGVNLRLRRQRLGVVGPNGAGKTTLLRMMMGQHTLSDGRAEVRLASVGCVAQGAVDWMLEDSLAQQLLITTDAASPEAVAHLLVAHKFPLALAQRPIASLSPGERVRAALICLFQRRPPPELLILDEPTDGLDFVGVAALIASLRAWSGGLVVTSHDRGFLEAARIDRYLELDGNGGHVIRGAAPVMGSARGTCASGAAPPIH